MVHVMTYVLTYKHAIRYISLYNIRDYLHNRVQQRDIRLIKPNDLKGFLIQTAGVNIRSTS